MSDTLSDVSTDTPSTVLDEGTAHNAVGAGSDAPEGQLPEEKQPEVEKTEPPKSRRDTIKAAAAKLGKEDSDQPAKENVDPVKHEPDKVETDAKSNPDVGVKPEKEGHDQTATDKPTDKPDDKERFREPPKRFLTKAKETWINTPNSVKAEVIRLERDYDELRTRATDNEQYRSGLKLFEDYAERNGVTLGKALEVYTGIDSLLKQNPVQAVADILGKIGMKPEQYAQIVLQNSPEYQARMMMPRVQQQSQQPQISPREQELQQQLAYERTARVDAEVIAPFRAAHPRFDELQEVVARCLNSGMIPDNLAPYDRLEAAYDMAERLAPRSASSAPTQTAQTIAQTANPRAGKSQVSGAPSSGQSTNPVARGKVSRREALRAAMDRASAS